MAATVTVDGITGPGITLADSVFSNVATFEINANNEVLELTFNDQRPPAYISIAAAATITVTVSASTYTVTIAN